MVLDVRSLILFVIGGAVLMYLLYLSARSSLFADPTSEANKLIEAALLKLKDVDVSSLPEESPFAFLEGYKWEGEPDQLTDYGRKE